MLNLPVSMSDLSKQHSKLTKQYNQLNKKILGKTLKELSDPKLVKISNKLNSVLKKKIEIGDKIIREKMAKKQAAKTARKVAKKAAKKEVKKDVKKIAKAENKKRPRQSLRPRKGKGGIKGSGDYFEDAGAWLGRKAAGFARDAISGMGDYEGPGRRNFTKIKMNSLFDGAGGIRFANRKTPKGAIRCSYKEEVGDVLSSIAFKTTNYRVNFGNPALFPVGYIDGQRYEECHFHGCIAFIESTASDVSTNTNLGAIYMAAQYDLQEAPFINSKQLLNSFAPVMAKSNEDLEHGFECARGQTMRQMLLNQDNVSVIDKDKIQDYDLCNFTVATEAQATDGAVIGKLFILYDVDLYKRRIPEITGMEYYLDPAASPNDAQFFGAYMTKYKTRVEDFTTILSATTMTFNYPGTYYITANRVYTGTQNSLAVNQVITGATYNVNFPGVGSGWEYTSNTLYSPNDPYNPTGNTVTTELSCRTCINVQKAGATLMMSPSSSITGSWQAGVCRVWKISSQPFNTTGIMEPVSSSAQLKAQIQELSLKYNSLNIMEVARSKIPITNRFQPCIDVVDEKDEVEELEDELEETQTQNVALKKFLSKLLSDKTSVLSETDKRVASILVTPELIK